MEERPAKTPDRGEHERMRSGGWGVKMLVNHAGEARHIEGRAKYLIGGVRGRSGGNKKFGRFGSRRTTIWREQVFAVKEKILL
jgi:hypothetical protein